MVAHGVPGDGLAVSIGDAFAGQLVYPLQKILAAHHKGDVALMVGRPALVFAHRQTHRPVGVGQHDRSVRAFAHVFVARVRGHGQHALIPFQGLGHVSHTNVDVIDLA